MIVDHLNSWRYYFTHPVWETIFTELSALNERTPEMEKKILGDDVVLKVFCHTTIDSQDDQAELESHRRYLDIHTSIINAERIDWYPASSLSIKKPYDDGEDAIYHEQPGRPGASIVMRPGLFALFGAADAHMTRLQASGKPQIVKKAVMKVSVDIPF